MKIFQKALGVYQVINRFPYIFAILISFPLNQVFDSFLVIARAENFFYFVFFFIYFNVILSRINKFDVYNIFEQRNIKD